MISLKQNHDDPSRPRLDPALKDRIDKLRDKLKIEGMPLSSVNNILCSIGLECLERSFDQLSNDLKQNDFVKNFLKALNP